MFILDSINHDQSIANWKTDSEQIKVNIHILVTSGKVEYKINNQTFIAKKGDLLFIPKDCIRSGKNFSQQVHEKYTILFRTSLMKNFDISFMNKQSCSFMKIANFEYYKQQFRLIYKEFKSREKYSQFIYEALLQELIFKIAREQEQNESSPMKLLNAKNIQDYLISHYREKINVNNLSSLIDCSPNYTTTIFKAVFNETPIQYMHSLRIFEACELLKYTNMSIENISEYLGYYDASYFSKTFKKVMGQSSKDYIKE